MPGRTRWRCYFSHLYRNAYVLCYLLAAAAVLIAVIGAYVENPILKLVLVALELFVIVAIIQLVRYGSKNAWHERWIDYRLVAESLRHARFLAYVSEFGLSTEGISPASRGPSGTSARPCASSGCRAPSSTAPISGRCCSRCFGAKSASSAIGTKPTPTRWRRSTTSCTIGPNAASFTPYGALCIGLVVLVAIIVLTAGAAGAYCAQAGETLAAPVRGRPALRWARRSPASACKASSRTTRSARNTWSPS